MRFKNEKHFSIFVRRTLGNYSEMRCDRPIMASEGWCKDEAIKLIQKIEKFVSDEEKEMCEKEISSLELNSAIKNLKCEKSPGLDSIQNEFYTKDWSLLEGNFL